MSKTTTKRKAFKEARRFFKNHKLATIGIILLLVAAGLVYGFREQAPGFPIPKDGRVFFGVQFDTNSQGITDYTKKLGATPALIGRYSAFPFSESETEGIDSEVAQIASLHSTLMLTVEPEAGLSSVTPQSLTALSTDLTRWNREGVPVIVRFAHEMNGAWYSWGQQPIEYVATFRRVADAVHKAPDSSTLWSPNEAGGYPYAGGQYEAKPGTADFKALDTNHDGVLTMADDPYAPYYPGNKYVDWVGLSVYHFGTMYPWGANVIPSPTKLEDKITGNYNYDGVNETALPNFYQEFAVDHNKPFAISETGALYNTGNPTGATELQIKSAWWDQLFSEQFLEKFPRLKLIVWFEVDKKESDVQGGDVDWRALSDPATTAAFKAAINPRYEMAP